MRKKVCLLFVICFFYSGIIFSQQKQKEYTSKNKKAVEAFEKGLTYLNKNDLNAGFKSLNEAIKYDSMFVEPYLVLADVYAESKDNSNAIKYYRKVTQMNPGFFPMAWFFLGELQMETKDYSKAKTSFKEIQKYKVKKETLAQAEKYVKQIDFIEHCLNNPVPFAPQNLGNAINTENDEYLPVLTADEQTLIFTRRFPRNEQTTSNTPEEEDFYVSQKANGQWTKAMPMPPPINTHGNEGAQCISPDGRFLYFTACNRKGGYGSCDLYVSELKSGAWSEPKNLGPNVNTNYWESQPSISPDGKTLYFTGNRPGGKGKKDIWKTTLNEKGTWGIPVNLGDSINTEEDEVSPFIHPDNQTLYFASNGHIGMGGMDIFYTRRKNDSAWATPVNVGCPINTEGDEMNFFVSASGKKALFSSDKLSGFGKQDIFEFDLYEEARPVEVTYLKGKIFDELTKQNLQADFEIINLKTGEVATRSKSDAKTGNFLVSLPTDQDYALNVSAEKYLFYSENFSVSKDKEKTPYVKDIALKPILVGESMVLKNTFFETNKWELKPESKIELDKLVAFMTKNKSIRVQIIGHTDNVGNPKSNQTLSENRAGAVYDYLIEKGIMSNRLSFKGMGETSPVDTNHTEEGRANNRRTECKITGIN